jgi:hypothetical protein
MEKLGDLIDGAREPMLVAGECDDPSSRYHLSLRTGARRAIPLENSRKKSSAWRRIVSSPTTIPCAAGISSAIRGLGGNLEYS